MEGELDDKSVQPLFQELVHVSIARALLSLLEPVFAALGEQNLQVDRRGFGIFGGIWVVADVAIHEFNHLRLIWRGSVSKKYGGIIALKDVRY